MAEEIRSWQSEVEVDRASIRPLYLQVKEALEDWIINSLQDGSLKPGDRLPSENELSEKLKISNITIKRALDELRRQGLIMRIQGRGSFVIGQKKLILPLQRLFNLTTHTREIGMRPERVTLEISEMAAISSIGKHLNIPAGAMVIKLVRLRLMDHFPVAVDTSYLPGELFPNLVAEYNDQMSLYEMMSRRYEREVIRAHDILGPVLINPYESKALEIPSGSLGIIFERTGYGTGDIPLEFTKMVFRGDLCDFSIDFVKESNER